MITKEEIAKEFALFFQRNLASHAHIQGTVPSKLNVTIETRELKGTSWPTIESGRVQQPRNETSAPPVPTVIEVFGRNGGPNGGTPRLIQGTNFVDGCQVKFDNDVATNVEVLTTEFLRCTVPPTTGTFVDGRIIVDVIVENIPNNSAFAGQLDNGFTYYKAPIVTSIVPNNGPGSGGTSVVIHGNYFHFSGNYRIRFGSSGVQSETRVDDTHINAVTASHPEGLVNVSVSAPDFEEQTGVLINGYTFGAPGGVGAAPMSIRQFVNGQPIGNYPVFRTGRTTQVEWRTGTLGGTWPNFFFVPETTWNGTIKLRLTFYIRQGLQGLPSSLEVSINGHILPHDPFFTQEINFTVINGVGFTNVTPEVSTYPPNTYAGSFQHDYFWVGGPPYSHGSLTVDIATP